MQKIERIYGERFFRYIDAGSAASAERVVPIINDLFKPQSVLDVGCGAGAWIRTWAQYLEASELLGVDGTEQDLAPVGFKVVDLEQGFNLGQRFSLVQCLETAEHLPACSADGLVASLARHGELVVFSAAQPGQGGKNHVNEQPPGYWIEKFSRQGFQCFDLLRPQIHAMSDIEPWYRYNTLVFAKEQSNAITRIYNSGARPVRPAELQEFEDLPWRCRRILLRPLPVFLVSLLAGIKERIAAARIKQ